MPRPSRTNEKRKELLPLVAQTFGELGYRRATTSKLAERCRVRENILYRLWPDKKSMFIASIDYVYEQAANSWREVLSEPDDQSDAALRLLNYQADHYGETGLQRIIFAGLNETDEPEVREALRKMYRRFHSFVRAQVGTHRNGVRGAVMPDETVTAWAIIGLANLVNIGSELGLLTDRGREKMFNEAGRLLLDGQRG